MHIGSHSIHYTAIKQASKQTQNTTKLDSTRFDVDLLFGVLRENAVKWRRVCDVYYAMRLSFFPTVFSTTSHSTQYRRATASACIFADVRVCMCVTVCVHLVRCSLASSVWVTPPYIILFLVVLYILCSLCLAFMWSLHSNGISHRMGFSNV